MERLRGRAGAAVRGPWCVLGCVSVVLAACAGDDTTGAAATATGSGTAAVTQTSADGGPTTSRGGGSSGPTQGTAGATADTAGASTDAGNATDDTGTSTGGARDGVCGDGVVDVGEGCDTPNGANADGCNEDCTISGAVLWSHAQVGGMGLAENLFGIAVDDRGNAYVCGAFSSAPTGADYWVRQYTADGGLGWTVSVSGPEALNDGARDLVLNAGALVVSGFMTSALASNDWRVAELQLSGAAGWVAAYNGPASGSDVGEAIAADAVGNVFVAGRHAVALQGQDVFVRQYLPGGAVGWSASYGGVAAGDDRAMSAATDGDGNVVVVGFETVSGQGRNGWIRKYGPAGGVVWTGGFAGVDALDDQINGVATDAAGNIVVVGSEGTAAQGPVAWVRGYDPGGNVLWTQTWAGAAALGANALDVAVDSVGDVAVVGTETTAGAPVGLVRKYDPAGNVRWTQTYGTPTGGARVIRAVTVGSDDTVWVAGGVDLGIDGVDAWVAQLGQ